MWGSKAHEFALVSWQSDLNPIWGQKIEGLVANFENIFSDAPFWGSLEVAINADNWPISRKIC